jgi:DNA-binding transcriptional ArsR family regulator
MLTYYGDMPTAGAPAVSNVFGVLAHPIRRRLIEVLASGDRTVAELAAPLPVSRPAVSQHLAVMRSIGVVSEERAGRQHRYRLHQERLDEVRFWLATLDQFWSRHLGRLADHLDGEQ